MSIHPTRAGKWEVRYREGRRNRSKTFTRKSDARRFETEQKYRHENGERIIRKQDTPTLEDFAVEWIAKRERQGKAANTIAFNISTLEKHILPTLGHLRLTELTLRRLNAWQADADARGASHYMLNRAREVLNQLLGDAMRQELVTGNPALMLDRLSHERRRGRSATPEQVEAMRGYFLGKKRDGYATLVSVLAYVGLRPAEALGVRWSSLQADHFVIDHRAVNGGLTRGTKTKRDRFPALPSTVSDDLARWKQGRSGLIFPRSSDGQPWRKTDWDNWRNRWFRPAAGAAGLLEWNVAKKKWEGDFVPYDLRHTCASLMIRANVPLTEIAAHLGHGIGVLSSIYAHDIHAMKGQIPRPVDAMIVEARSEDVRGTLDSNARLGVRREPSLAL